MEDKKQITASYALELYSPEMSVLSLGAGSTVAAVIDLLAEKLQQENWPAPKVLCASFETERLCEQAGFLVQNFNSPKSPTPLLIDGADAVDGQRRILKGGGGCFSREKKLMRHCVASNGLFVIVAQKEKFRNCFGKGDCLPLAIDKSKAKEVVSQLGDLGFSDFGFRKSSNMFGPLWTEDGAIIIDISLDPEHFGGVIEERISEIESIEGVIEHGLFTSADKYFCEEGII
jgi:ribose 5-phosphate isomerase A